MSGSQGREGSKQDPRWDELGGQSAAALASYRTSLAIAADLLTASEGVQLPAAQEPGLSCGWAELEGIPPSHTPAQPKAGSLHSGSLIQEMIRSSCRDL